MHNAANAIESGGLNAALALSTNVLERMDGIDPPADWVVMSAEAVEIVEAIELLRDLIAIDL
jgi:hypothetical protein